MVPWVWIPVALVAGTIIGVLLAALIMAMRMFGQSVYLLSNLAAPLQATLQPAKGL